MVKKMEKEKNITMDKILYEGEYLNGKRHGKGKQYYYIDGNLEFENEYLYNEKKKEKEYYNEESKLMFEGEYLYQKKWNGKLYDTNGNIISELINGNGKVKEYDEEYGYISFEGEYLNGKR